MAYEQPGFKPTMLTASADLSAKQFRLVKVSGAGTVTFCSAATDAPIGVVQNKPLSGEVAEIDSDGITKAEAGASLSAGAELMSDTVGRVITAATTGNRIIGIALDAASAAGEIIAVKLYSGAPKV